MKILSILVWIVATMLGVWMILSTNVAWIGFWGPWGAAFCLAFYPAAFIGSPFVRLAQGANPWVFMDYAAMVLFLVCVRLGSSLNMRLSRRHYLDFNEWNKV
jgi:hypothetical protein